MKEHKNYSPRYKPEPFVGLIETGIKYYVIFYVIGAIIVVGFFIILWFTVFKKQFNSIPPVINNSDFDKAKHIN